MNTMYKITESIPLDSSMKDVMIILQNIVPTKMYSFLLRKSETCWKCLFTVSVIDKYNYITYDDAILEIAKAYSVKNVIYAQPPLHIMYELFTPYMHKLTQQQHLQWQFLEYEDLFQLCCLSLCKLYNQGYYLNNKLLKTTFERDVLLHIRKQRTDFKIISLDTAYGKDDSLHIEDTIEDDRYAEKQFNEEYIDRILHIFEQVKDLIIDMIGERRFDQLYREYANKTTTPATTQTMMRIKRDFAQRNITFESLDN